MDPEVYDDPEEFRPERFSPENKTSIKTGTYMPWGLGPRQCMGIQLARMEARVLFFHLLRKYRFDPCEKTTIPLKWGFHHVNRLEGGCWLKMTPRN